ncbi:hypothetical protein, partial [Paraburkholderia sp.]|uniref:hypothetical protein n=1 Tax=Paraburkholderia sp. TaxID=1926495 RepID=UPI0034375294
PAVALLFALAGNDNGPLPSAQAVARGKAPSGSVVCGTIKLASTSDSGNGAAPLEPVRTTLPPVSAVSSADAVQLAQATPMADVTSPSAATATASTSTSIPPATSSSPSTPSARASARAVAQSAEIASAAKVAAETVFPALASAGRATPTPVSARPSLSYRNSWIGNTWGFANQRWMQIDIQAIAVTPDGEVLTNTPYDEGGGEVGRYRDGQLVQHGNETHDWGRTGGDAIAFNDDYVFTAQSVTSLGDVVAAQKNLPHQGEIWYGVARRSRGDLRKPMPFDGQVPWPNVPIAMRVMWKAADTDDFAIRGLAADATHLYVSNQRDNRIDIYDPRTMQAVGGYPVPQPGKLALAPDGTLWAIEKSRAMAGRRVVHHLPGGGVIGALNLPPNAVPVDLAVDQQGRLYVADNGPRQQVLVFTAGKGRVGAAGASTESAQLMRENLPMQLSSTVGELGGIYSGKVGAPGPLRFNGLTGVGVDRAGNVYVAMNGRGPRAYRTDEVTSTAGALLESYTPDGTQRFSLQGLLFVDGAQYVDGETPSVYTGGKRFTVDLTRPPGQEWRYAGFTTDRFRYPYDPSLNLADGQRGTPLVRDVNGHRLLYTIDPVSDTLRIYRFEPGSEIAIPSGMFSRAHIAGAWPPNQPARGDWIWRDGAGKGRFAPTDFDQNDTMIPDVGPKVGGWWVDSRGDVWQATVDQGIRYFPMQGFDKLGNPVYKFASMRTLPMPTRFTRLARILYNPETDTMYLSGSTPERPFNPANGQGGGSTLVRYDHWRSGPAMRYTIDWPDRGPDHTQLMAGFTVAGDYVFAVESMTGVVTVYDRDTGRESGHLAPAAEVGATSGTIDVAMPVSAHRLESGEYLVFVEEDWHGKVMMYRFSPGSPSAAAKVVAQTAAH